MVTKYLSRLLLIASFITVDLSSLAQDTLKKDKSLYYRAFIGMGSGSGRSLNTSNSPIGINLEFMVERNKTNFGIDIRTLSTTKMSIMNDYIRSYDLTVGRVLKIKSLFSSLNLGIGYVDGETWHELADGYESKRYKTIGFPVSVKVFIVPFRFYGLGVDLYANINKKSSFYGVNICHQFGLLRKVKKQ